MDFVATGLVVERDRYIAEQLSRRRREGFDPADDSSIETVEKVVLVGWEGCKPIARALIARGTTLEEAVAEFDPEPALPGGTGIRGSSRADW